MMKEEIREIVPYYFFERVILGEEINLK